MSIEVLTGNCLDLLPTLPAESVNCCVTSPPYWGLRDYGADGQVGLEGTPEEYVAGLVEVFRDVRRVLRDDGTCWCNLGDSYSQVATAREKTYQRHSPVKSGMWKGTRSEKRDIGNDGVQPKANGDMKPKDLVGIPWRVALALQADGWYLRSDVIWSKGNPMPESVTDRPTRSHEHVFLLTKSQRYWYDAIAVRENAVKGPAGSRFDTGKTGVNGMGRVSTADRDGDDAYRNLRDVWSINTQPFPGSHFAVFPYELAETCIGAGCPPQVCAACGKPWVRVVENGAVTATGGKGNRWYDARMDDRECRSSQMVTREKRTIAFAPTCDCRCEDTIPGTVLDPFSGAGTSGVVCRDLGLNYIGIELNPEYAQMSRDRIADPLYDTKLRLHNRIERENKEQPTLFGE